MNKTTLTLLSSAALGVAAIAGTSWAMPVAYAATLPSLAVSAIPHITDLAGSAAIQTQTSGPVDSEFASLETSYSAPLTSMYAWHGFCRQNGRDITVTLPSNSDVKTISIQLEQDASMGVYYPNEVDFQANVNGQWYQVASQAPVVPLTDKRLTTETFRVNISGLRTSQIRIHFPVGVWVFARRLEVMGTPNTTLPPALPAGATLVSNSYTGQNDSYGGTRGIRNMLIVYTGGMGSEGTWSPSDFHPMLSYSTPTGQTQGQMFDTMLFSPYSSMPDTQAGWQAYLQDLFTRGQQLDALNTAVGQLNQTTGTYNREKVVLTIPYPSFADGYWGYTDGQPISFHPTMSDPSALSAREHAINWYLQTLLSDWNMQGYQNLQLVGLYWEQEYVDYSSPGEVQMVQHTANMVHQYGYGFYWIPFYDASGLTQWKTFGFDAAWLQPNYSEQGSTADITRVENAAEYAKQNGLGVELELVGDVKTSQTQTSYEQTIQQLESDGLTSSVSHAFYAGSKGLVQTFNSSNPATHRVYDETHEFITHP